MDILFAILPVLLAAVVLGLTLWLCYVLDKAVAAPSLSVDHSAWTGTVDDITRSLSFPDLPASTQKPVSNAATGKGLRQADDPLAIRRDNLRNRVHHFTQAYNRWKDLAGQPTHPADGKLRQIAFQLQAMPANRSALDDLESEFEALAVNTVEALVSASDRDVDPRREDAALNDSLGTLADHAGILFIEPAPGNPVNYKEHHITGSEPATSDWPSGTVALLVQRGLKREADGELLAKAEIRQYN